MHHCIMHLISAGRRPTLCYLKRHLHIFNVTVGYGHCTLFTAHISKRFDYKNAV